ncbi:hypothetical protein M9H77_02396 [Catharanthus roseus]|uniref:Uncharacterized protein n=1 Tax=Catharanthus roseus TaxID=4058 RepID=A0ACC0C885_CATRO|nr:hypothetical protein M9H77_02396 [Catharanthus roseus]
MLRSLIWCTGTGNNVYTLRMNNKSCTCRKWQIYTLPCSHALAISRESGTRADTYVPDIYLREMYKRTYEANFDLVFNEKYWRDVPYNLTFSSPNMNKDRDLHIQEKRLDRNYLNVLIVHCGVTALYASPSNGIHATNSSASDRDAGLFCVLKTVQN